MVRSATVRRFGMPALLTRRSRPPSSSSARSAKAAPPSSWARSTAHMRQSGWWAWHWARTSARRSSRRAQMPTVAPCSARPTARAAPAPPEPPVTSAVRPSTPTAPRLDLDQLGQPGHQPVQLLGAGHVLGEVAAGRVLDVLPGLEVDGGGVEAVDPGPQRAVVVGQVAHEAVEGDG